jgi:hypothetical protein
MFGKCRTGFRLGAAVAVVAALACIGCGTKSAEERVNEELSRSGKEKSAVFPLAGHVTIDGQPPSAVAQGRSKLIVLLYDVAKPDEKAGNRPFTQVDPDGSFRFSTYGNADGVAPATYVFAFAQLNFRKKDGYMGPDGLKNLYNDPDKNATKPDLKIEHKAPGRTDYSFDLKTAGETEAAAGPKAVTKILTD